MPLSHSLLQQRLLVSNYMTAHFVCMLFTVGCVSVFVCLYAFHSASHPKAPHLYIRPCLCVPGGILSDRCLLPDAKWISPVWLSVPEGGVTATGLPASASLRGLVGGWDSIRPALGHKSLTWHSLAEEQTAQRHDLWEEISVASGVLALIGCQASHTPREEMNECARQSTLPAWVSVGLFFQLFVCRAWELLRTEAKCYARCVQCESRYIFIGITVCHDWWHKVRSGRWS